MEARGRFRVALSGGSTPRRIFETLARAPLRCSVDWGSVDVFWGDERAVSPDHSDSNFRMAHEALLSRIDIPEANIHRMPAEHDDLAAAARTYQARLANVFGVDPEGPPPAFDLVWLGLGPDGHTASLFPHTAALREDSAWVVENFVPKLDAHRMTLTAGTLNAARCVQFLVCGADKAEAVVSVIEGERDPERLPAQLIAPESGHLCWLLDEAAAGSLAGVEEMGG